MALMFSIKQTGVPIGAHWPARWCRPGAGRRLACRRARGGRRVPDGGRHRAGVAARDRRRPRSGAALFVARTGDAFPHLRQSGAGAQRRHRAHLCGIADRFSPTSSPISPTISATRWWPPGLALSFGNVGGIVGRILWGYVADQTRAPRHVLGFLGLAMAGGGVRCCRLHARLALCAGDGRVPDVRAHRRRLERCRFPTARACRRPAWFFRRGVGWHHVSHVLRRGVLSSAAVRLVHDQLESYRVPFVVFRRAGTGDGCRAIAAGARQALEPGTRTKPRGPFASGGDASLAQIAPHAGMQQLRPRRGAGGIGQRGFRPPAAGASLEASPRRGARRARAGESQFIQREMTYVARRRKLQ